MYRIKSQRSVLSGQTMFTVMAGDSAVITFGTRKQAQAWIKAQG